MGGFNVLNEIAVVRDSIPLCVLMALISIICLMVVVFTEFDERSTGCLGVAAATAVFAFMAFTSTQPTRYEITLKPGAIIDATRWDIVETRGEIYVIQERKPSAD